jgi:hypothetical protein
MNQQDKKNEKSGPAQQGELTCKNCNHTDVVDNFISFQPDGCYCPKCGNVIIDAGIGSLIKVSDIEDIRVIIKSKGKHYAILPKKNISPDEACSIRIATFSICLMEFHDIVSTALEYIIKKTS